jgi:DNA primase
VGIMDIINKELEVEKLVFLLESFLGEPRKHNRRARQISFDCPNCSAMKGIEYDHKGNLEISYKDGIYHCWACGETDETKGRLSNLVRKYSDKKTLSEFFKLRFKFNEFTKTEEKKDELKLPEEYIKLTPKLLGNKNFNPAFAYLYDRGINDQQIDKFNIGYCLTGKYQHRVVIPSYDLENKLNFFVTRAINPKVTKFKYLNPSVEKQLIIFNERLIDWEKPIFLVEGVFDHIVVPNSIPLLGKKISDKLFNDLYFKSKNFIIIALDPDAWNDTLKIYQKLDAGKLYKKILVTKLPDGVDLSLYNERYGQEHLKKLLQTSKRIKE